MVGQPIRISAPLFNRFFNPLAADNIGRLIQLAIIESVNAPAASLAHWRIVI
ncbi:Uncharacterised protein [Mycobacteroides abscessus subsp. abscessus]|nr:Uncharacterised protein [Mycobacteroides abscessus subsp. abscessus]